MLQKKRERSSEYNSYIRHLRGNEKKPFQSSLAVRSKDIVEFTRRMEKRKRDMLLEHNQQRKKESMKLYGEIKTDNIKVKELQK
uniref:Uncharacterized protein n=1 Tax=Ciona savignyi TaxID=51511 RepID=H2ZG49_CIOSA